MCNAGSDAFRLLLVCVVAEKALPSMVGMFGFYGYTDWSQSAEAYRAAN
jgi:hypothetical protein